MIMIAQTNEHRLGPLTIYTGLRAGQFESRRNKKEGEMEKVRSGRAERDQDRGTRLKGPD